MKKNSLNYPNKFYDIPVADCLNIPFEQSLGMLKDILPEESFKEAFDITKKYPSHLVDEIDTRWTKTAKIVGINPRLTKTYWGIVKYAMTFPENAIHIMPLFESGDGSLYVQNSWRLNEDFLDENLSALGYKTAQEQLKLVINVLHALGKIVGFDCLPHVDNFSEIVMLNPKYFEWVKLSEDKKSQIFDIDPNILYRDIEKIIIDYVGASADLYELDEEQREKIIFPSNVDRFTQRMALRHAIRDNGYEPIPVVEHSPMRPILFEKIVCDNNENWAQFKVPGKSHIAKIIGSITPFKWYRIDKNGYVIKDSVENEVWNYFTNKVNEFQNVYNFDFLRVDMAHNQISHSHNEEKNYKNQIELWRFLKSEINKNKPYFGTFAECFYSTYYIDAINDIENKNFDIVLGAMNFKQLGKEYFDWLYDFTNPFREHFRFNPCVAIFTNDGDKKRNQHLFANNVHNKIRYFISLFLNLPSYMGIGFEVISPSAQNDNEFSNRYVKKQTDDFVFGRNNELFDFISQMRNYYVEYKNIIDNEELELINLDDDALFAWKYADELLFIVKLKDIELKIEDCEEVYSNNFCYIYKSKP